MEKKKGNMFIKLMIILFAIYFCLFIASESGYYETKVSEKVLLTDNAIKKFENDIQKGEILDISTYLMEERKDYSNKFTKAGDKFSETVEAFLTDGVGEIVNIIKKLFI